MIKHTTCYYGRVIAICSFLVAARLAASVMFVDNHEVKAAIVLPHTPLRTEQYAAEELAYHIKLATGHNLPLFTEPAKPVGFESIIYLGATEAAARGGIDLNKLGADEFLLRSAGRDLFVVGQRGVADDDPLSEHNNCRGVLFGVYEMLERYVGVRWLWPGELGTFVPQVATFEIKGDVDIQQTPKLKFRSFMTSHIQRAVNKPVALEERIGFSRHCIINYKRDLEIYQARHRMGFTEAKPKTRHAFGYWWSKHGKEHPEWFMLRDDLVTRGPVTNANAVQRSQVGMCISNPELQRYILEEHWDGSDNLCLGECDVRGFCQCEQCKAMDGPQVADPPEFAKSDYRPQLVSDRYAKFWLMMHEKAVKRNPNVCITTFLYWNCFPKPEGNIRLHSKIYGEFVPWTGRPAYFPMPDEMEQWLREQWVGWEKTGISMGYRPNYFHGGYVMPHLSVKQAGEFLRFAYQYRMLGVSFDTLYGHWAVKGPMLYTHFRLFCDPELEVDKIRKEYYAAWGPAAKLVEQYFDYWEEKSYAIPGGGLASPIRAHRYYPPEVFLPAIEMLEQAHAVARKDSLPEYAARVEFLQTGLQHARLATAFTALLDYGSLRNFGSQGVDYVPVEIRDQARFEQCQRALRELTDFRKANEHRYFADLVYAASREIRYTDIRTLLGVE